MAGRRRLPVGVSFWQHVQGWFDLRHLPNVLLLHFNDLKTDLPGRYGASPRSSIIAIDEAKMPRDAGALQLRLHAAHRVPALADPRHGVPAGRTTFFNKGTNGRWKDALTAADLEKYDRLVRENLTPECARWMATGELPA